MGRAQEGCKVCPNPTNQEPQQAVIGTTAVCKHAKSAHATAQIAFPFWPAGARRFRFCCCVVSLVLARPAGPCTNTTTKQWSWRVLALYYSAVAAASPSI
jgi:hypothetical protein